MTGPLPELIHLFLISLLFEVGIDLLRGQGLDEIPGSSTLLTREPLLAIEDGDWTLLANWTVQSVTARLGIGKQIRSDVWSLAIRYFINCTLLCVFTLKSVIELRCHVELIDTRQQLQ